MGSPWQPDDPDPHGECSHEIERLQVALANIATMSPHYINGKFEDHASFASRLKAAALAAINRP